MHRSIKLSAVAFTLVGSIALAACGSDSKSTDSQAGNPTTTSRSSGSTPTTVTCTPAKEKSKGGTDVLKEIEARGKPKVEVPAAPASELVCKDLIEGTGQALTLGTTVTVHYVGVGQQSKKEFDASWNGGQPATFPFQVGGLIQGWTDGLVGMKVGGRRELVIPGALAYGPNGRPPQIGSDETLAFVVDLIAIS